MAKKLPKIVTQLNTNRLLAALPQEDYQRLTPHLKTVTLSLEQVLFKPDQKIESIYFPTQGVVSLISVMQEGSTTEIGLIGNEGVVGIFQFLGAEHANSRATVQVKGAALCLDANVLQAEFDRGAMLQKLLLRYSLSLFNQVSQTAACNTHHTIEQRVARWLLLIQDRIDQDQILLTQLFLSRMLGTRRASVNEVAINLQQQGIIDQRRGRIIIRDRQALEAAACECYQTLHGEYERLFKSTMV